MRIKRNGECWEAASRSFLQKKLVLKISPSTQENICVGVSLWKRDSRICVNIANFLRAPANGCFWVLISLHNFFQRQQLWIILIVWFFSETQNLGVFISWSWPWTPLPSFYKKQKAAGELQKNQIMLGERRHVFRGLRVKEPLMNLQKYLKESFLLVFFDSCLSPIQR